MSNKMVVLRLYKNLLREGQNFGDYNFRSYATRRIRAAFKENMNETDPTKIQYLKKQADENFELIKRQANIGKMYGHTRVAVEFMQT
uniref:LYR motif-containing protein 4 n=1 Tax=Hydra vulgaris TaxID=6087 RepID=T2M4J8_HYDVU